MVMRVLILTGGTVEENFAKDYISKWNPDQVITADKGLLYAKRLNIKPDIILGDFDSCSKDIMQEFSTDKKIIVPCEKDDTDTGLAIQKAIETGADEILMIGGTGTRLDHVMGNFGQLFYAHSKGVKAELVDSSNYNVYGSDCVCELYCILHNLRAERISNAHICIRRIPIFTI